jgi:hypothetical protein
VKLTPNALRSLEKRCARLASQACNVRDRVSDALFTSPPFTFTEGLRADLIAARIAAEDARAKLKAAEQALSRARRDPGTLAEMDLAGAPVHRQPAPPPAPPPKRYPPAALPTTGQVLDVNA